MSRLFKSIAILINIVALTGCKSAQLVGDQRDMRNQLLDLYEDQLMDNLIRASLNKPIIQIDFTNMTGQMTQTVTGSGGQTDTGLANFLLRIPAAAANPGVATYPLGGSQSNVWTYSVGATQLGQLTLTGNPLINDDDVYAAYDALGHDPTFLLTSPVPKDLRMVHVQRRYWDRDRQQLTTFWIPESRGRDFFNLYMIATVRRQTTLGTTATTSVVSCIPWHDVKTNRDYPYEPIYADPQHSSIESYCIRVRLSAKLVNDNGTATLSPGPGGLEMTLPYQPGDDAKVGMRSDSIKLLIRKTALDNFRLNVDAFISKLPGTVIKLKNDSFPQTYVPNPPTGGDNRVFNELQRQTLDHFVQ